MSLHGLLSVTMGVPDVAATAAYYADFGLTPEEDNWFATADGGRQLHIVPTGTRRLVEMRVAADDADDLGRTAASLERLGVVAELGEAALDTTEPVTGMRVRVEIAPRLAQDTVPATPYNGPGRIDRPAVRAPGFLREHPVRPRKLGHAVFGSTDHEASASFFAD
jgi:catechol 2,3-dioxygenase-like lactoylglutathione lyase family enzyme